MSIRVGIKAGPQVGVNWTESAVSLAAFTDATSGKVCPLTQDDWDAVFDVAGVARKTVHSAWGFQDASGSIVATVGTDLAASGTLTYEQSVVGWTRGGLRFGADVLARASWGVGVGPDPSATSTLIMGYFDFTAAPSANRIFFGHRGTPVSSMTLRTDERIALTVDTNTSTGTPSHVDGGVRPIAILQDITGSRSIAYSDLEKLAPTYSAIGDGTKGFGPGATAPPMDVLWGACFAGADAEWSDADLKAVLETLGWTIAWS